MARLNLRCVICLRSPEAFLEVDVWARDDIDVG
jgi:hypothetical protein